MENYLDSGDLFIYLFGRERFRFSAVLMSALCVCVHSEKQSVGLNAAV